MPDSRQWMRKGSVLLVKGGKALELSEFRFTFQTAQNDESSPNNCAIRVYNLKPETVAQVKGEYTDVVLQAGYVNGSYGIIFQGTIKQFRVGKENATTSYLDILAADGDLEHNFGVVNFTSPIGMNSKERVEKIREAMGLASGYNGLQPTGGVLPRGKVLFGMGRTIMQSEVQSQGSTWAIQNGKLNVIPLDGYLPGEAVVLTSRTGLIGRVEQTEEGMKAKCLLNPRLVPGGLVKIDNASINQTSNTSANAGNVPFNQWTGLQLLADVSADGLYRVYVVEHEGDSRGTPWYSNIVCLSVSRSSLKVKPYG